MTTPSYVDTGTINALQQQMLLAYPNGGSEQQRNNLQAIIAATTNTLASSQRTDSNLHTDQANVLRVVTTEKQRLDDKKDSVNNAIAGQRRLISLNDSQRMKNNDYTTILMILVICFSILIALSIINKLVPVIPSIIIYVLYILVSVTAVIMIYTKYADIISRDNINYNEIDLQGPKIIDPVQLANQTEEAAAAAQDSPNANLLSTINFGGCVGPTCCDSGTVWNSENSVCRPSSSSSSSSSSAPSPFTTLDTAYMNGELLVPTTGGNGRNWANIRIDGNVRIGGNVSPNSPNEFVSYSVY
jgi:hypothetical protein